MTPVGKYKIKNRVREREEGRTEEGGGGEGSGEYYVREREGRGGIMSEMRFQNTRRNAL